MIILDSLVIASGRSGRSVVASVDVHTGLGSPYTGTCLRTGIYFRWHRFGFGGKAGGVKSIGSVKCDCDGHFHFHDLSMIRSGV
jgi:hypothetical protein